MLPQILRACIVADYDSLFDELITDSDINPNAALLCEASESRNPHFKSVLAARMAASGQTEPQYSEKWKLDTHRSLRSSSMYLYKTAEMSTANMWESLYNGYGCNAGSLELLACLPEEWKIPAEGEATVNMDYIRWPTKPLNEAGRGAPGTLQSSGSPSSAN